MQWKVSIFIFYKGMEVNVQKILQKFAYLCEGGSVHGSPPNTDLTDKFSVCFRQNVAKQHNFLRIFNIWTFCWHFANMSTTCTTKFLCYLCSLVPLFDFRNGTELWNKCDTFADSMHLSVHDIHAVTLIVIFFLVWCTMHHFLLYHMLCRFIDLHV